MFDIFCISAVSCQNLLMMKTTTNSALFLTKVLHLHINIHKYIVLQIQIFQSKDFFFEIILIND